MKTAIKIALVALLLLFIVTPAHASYTAGQFGENCPGFGNCGIGASGFVLTALTCNVFDSNPLDAKIPCETSLAAYPANMPATVNINKLVWTFPTTTPMVGYVYSGVGLNTTERIYVDTNHTPTTSHTVITDNLVPAANIGSGGNSPQTYYIAACNSFPCNNADASFISYPGPTCTASNKTCYFNIWTPAPNQVLPFVPTFTVMGHEPATLGHPAEIPLLGLWNNGSFQSYATLTSLYPTYPANNTAHTDSIPPNGGNWRTSTGSGWTILSTPPAIYLQIQFVLNGITYICHADAQGNHNMSGTVVIPQDTCTTTTGADSGTAISVFYSGLVGSQSQDFRAINYDPAVGQYRLNVPDIIAPPAVAEASSNIEVFPCNSLCANGPAITGTAHVTITPTLYTDASSHIPAANTVMAPITFDVIINPVTTVTPDPPSSFSTDSNQLAYLRFAGSSVTLMCTNPNRYYGLTWWNQTKNTWLWVPPSPGDFSEWYTWNYDNARVYQGAKDSFLTKYDGTAWGDWAATTTFGSNYGNLIIKPTVNNPNGYVFISSTNAATGSSEPNWNNIPIGNRSGSDGGQVWTNLGNQTYYEACIKSAQEPYMNAYVLSGGSGFSQYSQFMGGAERSNQQTGDAVAKDGTTVTGLYSRMEIDGYCYNPGAPECAPDHGFYGGNIWGGAFSIYSQNAGRGSAYILDSAATFCSQAARMGQPGLCFSDPVRRSNIVWQQNAIINYWSYTQNQTTGMSPDGLYASNAFPATLPYMYGLGMEALIEWEIVDKALDPTNAQGLLDDRIDAAIEGITAYIWSNWFDQPFAHQGIHTYSLTYDPKDLQVLQGAGGSGGGTSNAFFNELNNLVTVGYDYVYAKFGGTPGLTLPDGTTYDLASDLMRMGGFEAYNCTGWFCSTFGDGKWIHPYSAGTGTPKEFGQQYKQGLGNSYQWRSGYRATTLDDLSPSVNPCRDGSNGANPCASGHHSPFADTVGAYMTQIQPIGSNYGQLDPTDCVNGSPHCHFTGDSYSPFINITNTSVQVQFHTYEKTASAKVNWGTSANNCTSGSVTAEHPGYPICRTPGYTTLEDCYHLFDITNLQPSTNYYTQFSTTDLSGNVVTNNCNITQGNWQGGGANFTTQAGPVQLTILTTTLPNGVVTIAYNQSLSATGGTLPYTWSTVAGHGTLPPGLNLSAAGVISGTPTTQGSYTFRAQVQDSSSPQQTATQDLTIVVTSLVITTSSLPNGAVGVVYSSSVAATGGTTPYTWSVPSGGTATLPAGLSLNSSTGAITGTPTLAGNYLPQFTVVDSSLPQQKFVKTVPLTVIGTCVLSVATASLPGGTVGTLYSQTLAAACGSPPYSWSIISGALPAGLSLSSAGVISGTPTTAGTASFTVQVQDSLSNTASKALSIVIASNTLTITTTSLPNGTIGVAYSATVQATGGTPSFTWSISAGALPAGLGINPSTGAITGSPTQNGLFNFTVQVQDSGIPVQTATANLSITIQSTSLVITTTTLPPAELSAAYSFTLSAIGGVPPYVNWTVISGALPPGTSLNSGSGIISGTATATGVYSFTVQVQDSGTPQQTATANLSLSVTQVRITNVFLNTGTIAVSYSQTLTGSGGVTPYVFSLLSGTIPNGMTLNSSTGVISGTPTVCGFFSNTWQITDANNLSNTKFLPLDILGCPLAIVTTILPGAFQNVAYSATLQATGGTNQSYSFAVTSGSLPTGLSLSTAGAITGTPTGSGTSTFTVTVTDSGSNTAPATLSITVSTGVTITTTTVPPAIVNQLYSAVLQAVGGTLPYSWCVQEPPDFHVCDDGSNGALPTGLTLGALSGFITGTPTVPGVSSFTVQVTDANNNSALQVLSIVVSQVGNEYVIFGGQSQMTGHSIIKGH